MKAKKNNIDKALEALRNIKLKPIDPNLRQSIKDELDSYEWDTENITEINNMDDANKYLKGRKESIVKTPMFTKTNMFFIERKEIDLKLLRN